MDMMANEGGINHFNDDVFHNILARLPALSFASAACVSKTWYRACGQILSRPKLVSALSLNPSLIGAVAEVLEKVLCKPIRPDFAIACISEKYGLRLAHTYLTRALGAKTPLVTHISNGVMGKDALTDELKEVQWEYFDYSCPHPRESNVYGNANQGILLVVGYLPGLKVDAVPLFHPKRVPEITMIDYDKFVREIKAYAAAVSGGEFPSAIMLFGDRNSDVNSIVAKLDHAMPEETPIVGDAGGCFLFNSLNYTITSSADSYILDAVALVFAKDKDKSPDVGETYFHVVMAGGLMPFGPRFEAVAVGVKPSTKCSWLCAKMEGVDVILNMEAILETVDEMVDDQSPNLYIAVTQRRSYNSMDSTKLATSTAFYQVLGGGGPCFFIDGVGVRPGDSFMFYHRDLETAHTTSAIAFDNLEILKEKTCDKDGNKTNKGDNMDGVFGGLIFSCYSRGESYFGEPNVDISPFSRNFPGVPVAGVFCKGEIGRGTSRFITAEEDQEQSPAHCCRHASSAVYLVMSYLPSTKALQNRSKLKGRSYS